VDSGQVFTLLGRNGAGKTTFLRIAATQLSASSGSIFVLGADVKHSPDRVRRSVACVPQEGNTVGPLTPWDHVYLALLARGMSRTDANSPLGLGPGLLKGFMLRALRVHSNRTNHDHWYLRGPIPL